MYLKPQRQIWNILQGVKISRSLVHKKIFTLIWQVRILILSRKVGYLFLVRMNYNLGQKVGDKFIKLSKIGFSMECFTADLLQFFTKKRQNVAFGWKAGYSPSNSGISGIFLNFPNFLRSKSLKSFGNSWGNSYIHFLVIIM